MMLKITSEKLIYLLICICAVVIFFQQVCVINIGGSFKLYEFIALLLCLLFIANPRKRIYSLDSAILFLLFIGVTSISYLFYLLNADKLLYYERFPEAKDILRANVYFGPTVLLIYYFFNWVTYNEIVGSKLCYLHKDKIIRLFVFSGTIISVYNLYSYFGGFILGLPDLVPSFLDSRNATAFEVGRVSGFSDEPGSYIFLQAWVLLYTFFYKRGSAFNKWYKIINVVSALLTFSSALVAVFGVFILSYFIQQKGVHKLSIIFGSLVIVIIVYQLIVFLGLEDLMQYVLIDKVSNFFSTPTHTMDSGSFRAYTARLGYEVFKDYPIIGVGGGASCFFVWMHEFNVGIETFGETISNMTYPQNIYAKILSELGIIGITLFILFFVVLTWNVYRLRNENSIFFLGQFGILLSLALFASIYPETSLFIWFNLALLSNEVKFKNEEFLSNEK